jgi:hypothetical protein
MCCRAQSLRHLSHMKDSMRASMTKKVADGKIVKVRLLRISFITSSST